MTTQATSNNGYVYDPMSWYKASGRRIVLDRPAVEEKNFFVTDSLWPDQRWPAKGMPIAEGKTLVAMTEPNDYEHTGNNGELLVSAEVIRHPEYALAFRNPNYEWIFHSISAYLALFVSINLVQRNIPLRERKIPKDQMPFASHGDRFWDMWEAEYEKLLYRFRKTGQRFSRNNFTDIYVRGGENTSLDMREKEALLNYDGWYDRVGTDYREYLESPHWHLVRAAAIVKADYRCQLCNSPDNLQVHHRTYERRGEEKLSDVTVLCRDCHRKFHGLSSD